MSFGGGNQQKKALEAQNEQINQNWIYNKKNYEYQWGIDSSTVAEDGSGGQQLYNADGTKKGSKWEQHYYNLETLEKRKQADKEAAQYQEDTALQDWEMGKSQQEYEWSQQDKYYDKSEDQYENSVQFNQIAYNDALERERKVLDEQFIQSAFENQGLIQDLYEATGSKGFDQVSQKLGLLKQEDTIESQKQQALTSLKQQTSTAKYRDAETKLGMLSAKGKSQYERASLVQDLGVKEGNNRFKQAAISIDMGSADRQTSFQNEVIRRENSATYARAAHEGQERAIESLKRQGAAQLSQSGRSQGKAVQMVLAELGRQNAFIAETLIRGSGLAEARAKQNQKNLMTNTAKSKLALNQIQEDNTNNLYKTLLNLEENQRNLKVSDARSSLNLDEIRSAVFNNIENTSLNVKTLENNLKHAQTATGLNLKKIDWDVDNIGSRFTTNQDILKASLDSAVEVSALNQKDILRGRQQADLDAEARRMIDPSIGRDELSLENYKPLDLPEAKYQDPIDPEIPPAPMRGAMQDTSMGAAGVAGAAAGAAIAGVATATTMAASSSAAIAGAATPVGWAVAALSFLSQM